MDPKEFMEDFLPKPAVIEERLKKNAENRRLLMQLLKLSKKAHGEKPEKPENTEEPKPEDG